MLRCGLLYNDDNGCSFGVGGKESACFFIILGKNYPVFIDYSLLQWYDKKVNKPLK